ncbi:MAG: XrtA system polysaccharide deacetylase [Gemmatimonadaceae bacterium]
MTAKPATPTMGGGSATPHIFTVDVEEYFQVGVFDDVLGRDQWDRMPSRIEASVETLLDLLARHGAVGTFFTLGWIADRRPQVVRRIAEGGHEIASHGWWHRRVNTLTVDEFREDARASKAILEDVSGQPVGGYRAPNFSITPGHEWAFDVLLEEGYRYDSSLFPIRRPGYGYPEAPPLPYLINRAAGSLCELPLATTLLGGMRVPAAGGAYFRHLPYALTRRAFREHSEGGIPGLFYIHPWELDPEQPRLRAPIINRVRHYHGLHRTLPRLELLLAEFRFTSAVRRLGIGDGGMLLGSRVPALPQ